MGTATLRDLNRSYIRSYKMLVSVRPNYTFAHHAIVNVPVAALMFLITLMGTGCRHGAVKESFDISGKLTFFQSFHN